MYIQNNISGMTAWRHNNTHQSKIAKAIERLSSGCRINRAADDPGNIGRVENMKAKLRQIEKSQEGIINEISLKQTIDGIYSEKQSVLRDMVELATEAATGTLTDSDRKNLDKQYQQLMNAYNDMSKMANEQLGKYDFTLIDGGGTMGKNQLKELPEAMEINGNNLNALLDGLNKKLDDFSLLKNKDNHKDTNPLKIEETLSTDTMRENLLEFIKTEGQQLLNTKKNADSENGINYTVKIVNGEVTFSMRETDRSKEVGFQNSNILTQEDALKALDAVKKENSMVSSIRGDIGATINGLEHTLKNLQNLEINTTDALSRIADADMAKEMMELIKEQVLAQTSAFAMMQSNHHSEQVLELIKA